MGHADVQRWDAPGILQVRVHFDEVVVVGQRFAKSTARNPVRPRDDSLLVARPKTLSAEIEFGTRAALISVAAEEALALLAGAEIAKADDVDSIGAMRAVDGGFLVEPGEPPSGARARGMIHQAAPQQSAGITQPRAAFASGGIQQNTRGFQRLCAQNHGLSFYLAGLVREPVNVSHSRSF